MSWWTVLRSGLETPATWPGALQGNAFAVTWEGTGKALRAHGRVSCPGGPCFGAVLKTFEMDYMAT